MGTLRGRRFLGIKAGIRGTIEFLTSGLSCGVGALGLRFNGTAFTSINALQNYNWAVSVRRVCVIDSENDSAPPPVLIFWAHVARSGWDLISITTNSAVLRTLVLKVSLELILEKERRA
jgi:hypothetical protein